MIEKDGRRWGNVGSERQRAINSGSLYIVNIIRILILCIGI